MNEEERELLDKAAIEIYGALIARNNESGKLKRDLAAEAWGAAYVFLDAKKDYAMSRYEDILDRYDGAEALRKIFELCGTTGRSLDSVMARYENRPDPLRFFADEPRATGKTNAQIAVARWLQRRGKLANTNCI
jgi:hypothetical protein